MCTLTNSERGEAEAINSIITEQIQTNVQSLSRNNSLKAHSQLVQAFPDVAMQERQNRKTYLFIVQALQQIYRDVNVSSELQAKYVFEVPYTSSLAAVNSTLQSSLKDATNVLPALKLTLQESCPEDQTRVYTIDFSSARSNFFEGSDGVWSQNFLYYNVITKKIVVYILKAIPNDFEEDLQYDGYPYQVGVLDSESQHSSEGESDDHVIYLDSNRQEYASFHPKDGEIYDIE